MKPLRIHAQAEAEIREAAAYYEGQRAGLGREFRTDLEQALFQIRRDPLISAPIDEQGTRKHRLRRFPYTVYHVDLEDTIWIAAVAHQKRRPGYWSGRAP